MIMLGGSFITVNVATDGQLVEKVTETIQVEVNKNTLNDLDSKSWVELDEGDEVLEFTMQYDYVDEK